MKYGGAKPSAVRTPTGQRARAEHQCQLRDRRLGTSQVQHSTGIEDRSAAVLPGRGVQRVAGVARRVDFLKLDIELLVACGDGLAAQDHLAAVAIQLDGCKTALGPLQRQMLALLDAYGPEAVADVSGVHRMLDKVWLGVSRRVAGNPATGSAGDIDERHLRSIIPLGNDDSLAAVRNGHDAGDSRQAVGHANRRSRARS